VANCSFCSLPEERILRAGALCLVFADGYPVSPGHSLVIPRRHVGSFFETTQAEREEIFGLLDWRRGQLMESDRPAAFNIGINDGKAAGQTVVHLHIHLIPRYAGDKPDPRGGVRWIFPDKADYWSRR
jgi:diadenosine tetraphosphate (Ap4A) HIT family hydrolase